MTIFYLPTGNGFYDEADHGARTITVPDPNWIRPTVAVPDPAWGAYEDDQEPPMIQEPDMSAVHPMVEVPNSKCTLPPASELVEITSDLHKSLLAGQKAGKQIVAGKDGMPTLKEPPAPTAEELGAIERAIRDRVLLVTDPLIARHRDELETERPTTLTAAQYKQLQGYRQDLRDWPESEHFPAVEYRPEQPAWLAEQIQ